MNNKWRTLIAVFTLGILLTSCAENQKDKDGDPSGPTELALAKSDSIFRIAFGSCNQVNMENRLWGHVLDSDPQLWIWGGDIIYADTEDMDRMERMYNQQREIPGYKALREKVEILGVWDDHDYGVNDGGLEYSKKRESQQKLLDFLDVPKDDPRRAREGIYHLAEYEAGDKKLGVVLLDTRYFRSRLTKSATQNRRYQPEEDPAATMLGEAQWAWLEGVLTDPQYDLFVVMSSVQLLSSEHGFETWGNFPQEVQKLRSILARTGTTPVIFLSGDRHISELSRADWEEVAYPVFDFTSSGLTHSYSSYTGEPNRYRVGEVVVDRSFGLLDIEPSIMEITFTIVGEEGQVLSQNKHRFP